MVNSPEIPVVQHSFLNENFILNHAILPLVRESIIVIDADHTVMLINESARFLLHKVTGHSVSIGDPVLKGTLPGCEPVVNGALMKALGGETVAHEYEVKTIENDLLWINCTYNPIVYRGRIRAVSLIIEDVSVQKKLEQEEKKRKEAEEEGMKQRLLFELFVENAPLRAWITDVTGNVIFMNRQYLNAFHFGQDKVGKNLMELFPEKMSMNFLREIRKVHRTQQVSEIISEGFRDDGSKGYFKISRFPLQSAGMQMVGGWAIDITDERDLQKKLVKNEKRKKQEIVRSIIEAQERERMGLSVELHDNVNQILSSCKLMLEMARDHKEAAEDLARKCYQNLITAISEIRRISHNLNPSAIQDIGLNEAIEELIHNVNVAGRMQVNFHCTNCGNVADLMNEDKIAIFRILQEMLSNIMKHAAATEVNISVYYYADKVCMKVQDNGKGFSLNKARRGLGLRTILHRISYYRGRFFIRTAPGQGCTIKLVLYAFSSNKKKNDSSVLDWH